MSSTPDIGRLVQLIMENPSLVEEISKLGEKDSAEAEKAKQEEPAAEAPASVPNIASIPENPRRNKRTQLLGALKPYLSGERAKAIDSMISVVEIIELMKTR